MRHDTLGHLSGSLGGPGGMGTSVEFWRAEDPSATSASLYTEQSDRSQRHLPQAVVAARYAQRAAFRALAGERSRPAGAMLGVGLAGSIRQHCSPFRHRPTTRRFWSECMTGVACTIDSRSRHRMRQQISAPIRTHFPGRSPAIDGDSIGAVHPYGRGKQVASCFASDRRISMLGGFGGAGVCLRQTRFGANDDCAAWGGAHCKPARHSVSRAWLAADYSAVVLRSNAARRNGAR